MMSCVEDADRYLLVTFSKLVASVSSDNAAAGTKDVLHQKHEFLQPKENKRFCI